MPLPPCHQGGGPEAAFPPWPRHEDPGHQLASQLKVTDTEPALKGATAAAQYKPATLETGLKVQVPPFIAIGELITVDTRTGEYTGRVKES